MIKYFYILSLVTISLSAQDNDSIVTPLWGPPGGLVKTVVSDKNDIIYISSNNGIFRSTDFGLSWRNVYKSNVLFLGINDDGVLLIESSNPDLVLISDDNGDNWEEIKIDVGYSFRLNTHIKGFYNNIILIEESTDNVEKDTIRLFYTTNFGMVWNIIKEIEYNGLKSSVYTILNINDKKNISYSSVCYYSSNNQYQVNTFFKENIGDDWTESSIFPFDCFYTLQLSKDTIIISSSKGVYLTIDRGINWALLKSGIRGYIYKYDSIYYYCFKDIGLYISENVPDNFNKVNSNSYNKIIKLKNGRLLAFDNKTSFYSDDNGTTMQASNNGFCSYDIYHLTVNKDNIILCNFNSTNDKGLTWIDYNYDGVRYNYSDKEGNIYVICGPLEYKLVLRSTNNGATFDTIAGPGTIPIGTRRLVVNNKGYIFIADILYRSIDKGKTWEKTKFGGRGLSINSEGHLFLVNDYGGIFRSTDDGLSGERVQKDIDDFTDIEYWSMLFSPYDSIGYAYSTDWSNILYKTTNNGRSWKRIDGDFFEYVNAGCIDSSGNTYLLAGSDIYIKIRWQDSFVKYKLSDIYTFLDIQAAPDGEIYLGSERGGLFRLNRDLIDSLFVEEVEPSPLFAFPNPARDYIEIDAGTGRDLSLPGNTIHVYNAIGECVGAGSEPAHTKPAHIKIDVSGLPPGVYFVRSGGSCTKFVKGE